MSLWRIGFKNCRLFLRRNDHQSIRSNNASRQEETTKLESDERDFPLENDGTEKSKDFRGAFQVFSKYFNLNQFFKFPFFQAESKIPIMSYANADNQRKFAYKTRRTFPNSENGSSRAGVFFSCFVSGKEYAENFASFWSSKEANLSVVKSLEKYTFRFSDVLDGTSYINGSIMSSYQLGLISSAHVRHFTLYISAFNFKPPHNDRQEVETGNVSHASVENFPVIPERYTREIVITDNTSAETFQLELKEDTSDTDYGRDRALELGLRNELNISLASSQMCVNTDNEVQLVEDSDCLLNLIEDDMSDYFRDESLEKQERNDRTNSLACLQSFVCMDNCDACENCDLRESF